jgi:hypothetical protein
MTYGLYEKPKCLVALLPKCLNFAKIEWSIEHIFTFFHKAFKKEEEVIMYTIFSKLKQNGLIGSFYTFTKTEKRKKD